MLLFLLRCFFSLWLLLFKASSIVTAKEVCENNFWSSELAKMNAIIDDVTSPCEDFHQYACGLWRVPYKLRYLHARDTLTTLRASNEQLLIDYFEQQWIAENHTLMHHEGNDGGGDNAVKGVAAVTQFFESCMNNKIETERRERDNLQIYRNFLLSISDWPVLNPDYPTNQQTNASFNWSFVSARLRRYGVNSFWRLLVQQNWQAAEQTVIYLAPLRFELLGGERANFDEEKLFLYKRYIKHLLLALNVRVRAANRIADEVIEFEQELRSLSINERDFVLHEPQTLYSLDQESPTFKLRHYFDNLFDDEQTQLSPDYPHRLLIVADKNHLRRLVALLSRTNAETIGKYLLVKFLVHFEVHLQQDQQDYNEQKHDCLLQMHNLLPRQLTHLYLRLLHKTSGNEGKEDYDIGFLQRTQIELTSMVEQLKQQFEKMLNATNVFDRDAVSRALGLEKLRSMRLLLPQIEQPTNAINPPIENELTSNYHHNLIVLHKFQTVHELAPILRSISQIPEGGDIQPSMGIGQATQYSPLNVNAYYKLKNIIELPIGILRAPIYDRCMAPAKIYGGLLYIIAHELMHGFDYDGMNYDKSGNVANAWNPKAIIQYGLGSSCFMTSRYPNAPLNINENIADSEGLRLALETFSQSNNIDTATQRVEQLKLFFISFAQVWCGREADSSGTVTNIGLHASHKDRVNNAVRNFEEFVEAFKCHKGQEMYTEEKCRIW